MCGFSGFFSDWTVLCGWNDRSIGFPEISITSSPTIVRWYRLPQFATGDFITITQLISNNLARFSTNSQPYPDFIGLLRNKGPELINFEGIAIRFTRLWIN